MKAVYAIPVATLALAVALVARAEPAAPLGGASGTANYNPKELQVDKIQSPRDPASGQATGKTPSSSGDQPEMTLRDSAGGQQGQIMQDYYAHSNVVSPRDPASGQATGIQSPRDAASGQATGRTQSPGSTLVNNENIPWEARGTETAQPGQFMSGGNTSDGQGIRREQPTQANGSTLVYNENLTSARGTETAQPGQFAGSGHDGQGIRKPRPNKNPRKGRRMHKP